jgi:hypothetical protein
MRSSVVVKNLAGNKKGCTFALPQRNLGEQILEIVSRKEQGDVDFLNIFLAV